MKMSRYDFQYGAAYNRDGVAKDLVVAGGNSGLDGVGLQPRDCRVERFGYEKQNLYAG